MSASFSCPGWQSFPLQKHLPLNGTRWSSSLAVSCRLFQKYIYRWKKKLLSEHIVSRREKNYVLCYVDVEKDQCLTHSFSFKFKFILQIEALLLAICFKHLLQADFWLFFIETLFILYIQSFIWFLKGMNALIPLLLWKLKLFFF